MATPAVDVVKANWKQLFPWAALFRTFGLALHIRQIGIGIVASGLVSLAFWIVQGEIVRPPLEPRLPDWNWASWVWLPMVDLTRPIVIAIHSVQVRGLSGMPTWWDVAQIVFLLLWVGTVSGLAGGILVRRAALEFCREESLGVKAAIGFVWSRGLDYLTAPGLPLVMVLGLGLLLATVGLLAAWVPGGMYLVSATWAVWIVVGLSMALLLAAVVLGWPLMIAAVSINGGDGFDALSRGFGFVMDRSRYYAWCALLMTVYGTLIYYLIWAFSSATAFLTIAGLVLGMGRSAPASLPQTLPPGMFLQAVGLVLSGFAYSFFWSNITVIYLVLRKSVDNADLTDVYIEGGAQAPDELQALLSPNIGAGPVLLPIVDPPNST